MENAGLAKAEPVFIFGATSVLRAKPKPTPPANFFESRCRSQRSLARYTRENGKADQAPRQMAHTLRSPVVPQHPDIIAPSSRSSFDLFVTISYYW